MNAGRLLDLLERRFLPTLPASVREKMANRTLVVEISRSPQADGLFLDPGDWSARELRVQLRESLLTSQNAQQLLAHEYFHALHYVIHPDEEPWVREGLAQLFEFIVLGYFNGVHASSALRDLTYPLMGEHGFLPVIPAEYGHSLLYFYYLWSQCGGTELFWRIAEGIPGVFGREGIGQALAQSSFRSKIQCSSFRESALSFEVARVHNQTSLDSPDPSRFRVFSTSIAPAAMSPVRPVPGSLRPYAPVVLASPAPRLSASPDVEVFWLRVTPPYSVRRTRPSGNLEEWRQVLVKAPR